MLLTLDGRAGHQSVDPGGLQVDEAPVDVVDMPPNDVLELCFKRGLCHPGHHRAGLPLLRDVARIGDVEIVLRRPARPLVGELSIGDELRVHIDERIGAEARGQDVGIGLCEFVSQGADVEVTCHDSIDGRVERDAVGGPLVVEDRVIDRGCWARNGGRCYGRGECLGQRHAAACHHRGCAGEALPAAG